jgi:hypothetical protein
MPRKCPVNKLKKKEKKMKNIILIGLFCMTLTFSACSSSSKGVYVGEVTIKTFPQSGDGKETEKEYKEVIATVTEEGGGTIEFSNIDAIKNCKIQLKSLEKSPGFTKEETCKIAVDGITESFTMNRIALNESNDDPDRMTLHIVANTSGSSMVSKIIATIIFRGERYGKK